MGTCIICGKSTGFFSLKNKCNDCKTAEEKAEKDKKEREQKKALAPYLSAKSINDLPIIDSDMSSAPADTPRLLLKKDEKIFAAHPVFLCEYRKDRHFEYGSEGFSFKLTKTMTYRVGQGRGHMISNDVLTETSKGLLFVTNKRLMLHPIQSQDKPLSIKLSDIESYTITEDAITIYKEGRQSPLIFKFYDNKNGIADDIFGITLNLALKEL